MSSTHKLSCRYSTVHRLAMDDEMIKSASTGKFHGYNGTNPTYDTKEGISTSLYRWTFLQPLNDFLMRLYLYNFSFMLMNITF